MNARLITNKPRVSKSHYSLLHVVIYRAAHDYQHLKNLNFGKMPNSLSILTPWSEGITILLCMGLSVGNNVPVDKIIQDQTSWFRYIQFLAQL